jgi:hypothetical protein
VVRGATFACGLAVVVVVDLPTVLDVEVVFEALLLLDVEPHPTNPMPKTTIMIAPLIAAVRFMVCSCRSRRAAGRDNRRIIARAGV